MAKRYLNVSYEDRELAKRLGAKWDPSVRRWYCVADSPLSKIFEWRKETKLTPEVSEEKKLSSHQSIMPHNTQIFKRSKSKSTRFEPSESFLSKSSENLELFA